MEAQERETIICLNDGDRADGFFTFGTSIKRHLDKMLKRIGGEKKLHAPIKTSSQGGKVVYWSAKVPIRYLSNAHFGLRTSRSMADRSSNFKRVKQG